ncbi:MAG TPA: hypothetical protein VEH05_02155, partial [Streptosporangiaceae bacterium]|nr:hypothetical protein [Streptosporangiaceae bacterium]
MPTSASKRDARRQRRQARLAAAGLTRRALVPWDRLKFVVLIVVVWFLIVWYQMANDPVLGFTDAARQQLQVGSGAGRWLVLLLGLEVFRQIYYLITEHSRRAYRASSGFFGGSERLTHRAASDYTRFRLSRAFKWLVFIAVVAVILGLVYHTTPVNGLFQAPATIYHLLPDILIFVFYMLLVVAQFGMLFWFLS